MEKQRSEATCLRSQKLPVTRQDETQAPHSWPACHLPLSITENSTILLPDFRPQNVMLKKCTKGPVLFQTLLVSTPPSLAPKPTDQEAHGGHSPTGQ